MSCTCSVCGCAASARVNRAALTCSSCIGERCAAAAAILDIASHATHTSAPHTQSGTPARPPCHLVRPARRPALTSFRSVAAGGEFVALRASARTVGMLTTPRTQAKARRASALASRLETRLDRLRRSRELLAAELREGAAHKQATRGSRKPSDSHELSSTQSRRAHSRYSSCAPAATV